MRGSHFEPRSGICCTEIKEDQKITNASNPGLARGWSDLPQQNSHISIANEVFVLVAPYVKARARAHTHTHTQPKFISYVKLGRVKASMSSFSTHTHIQIHFQPPFFYMTVNNRGDRTLFNLLLFTLQKKVSNRSETRKHRDQHPAQGCLSRVNAHNIPEA